MRHFLLISFGNITHHLKPQGTFKKFGFPSDFCFNVNIVFVGNQVLSIDNEEIIKKRLFHGLIIDNRYFTIAVFYIKAILRSIDKIPIIGFIFFSKIVLNDLDFVANSIVTSSSSWPFNSISDHVS